jgi:ribonucleotide monophosphatase NagD (HAD superfamily)
MGLTCTPDEAVTSLGACRSLVQERGLRPLLLLSPEAAEEFAAVDTQPPHNAVVLGLHPPSFVYEKLNTAFRVLKGEPLSDGDGISAEGSSSAGVARPVLIAPHKAAYHQAPETTAFPPGLSLGIGAYVRALEEAAGVEAEVVGKPTASFYQLAMTRMGSIYNETGTDKAKVQDGELGFENSEIAIVGDDINNDLGAGALELGLQRVLVRTGKYRPGAEDGMDVPPDAIYDTFADFVDGLVGAGAVDAF